MDQKTVIEIYLTNIRLNLNKLDRQTMTDLDIDKVVNNEYANMRVHFDKTILSTLTEDEIEEFFETIESKTNELLNSFGTTT